MILQLGSPLQTRFGVGRPALVDKAVVHGDQTRHCLGTVLELVHSLAVPIQRLAGREGSVAGVDSDAQSCAVQPSGKIVVLRVGQRVHGVDDESLDAAHPLISHS